MRYLLIDTCGAEGSVALADTQVKAAIVAVAILPGRTSSERLVPVIRELLSQQAWALRDLIAIVVVHGPGSFTGVRVGMSAAKGLSEASQVPLIAVSRLAVLALQASVEGAVHVALDAGRGEVYYGCYQDTKCIEELLLTLQELKEIVGASPLLVCEPRLADALNDLSVTTVPEPRAEAALPIAVQRAGRGDFDDASTLDANYLRRTDAQLFARPVAR